MMGTHLQTETCTPTLKVLGVSDASTQMELIRKQTSMEKTGCNECLILEKR